MSLHKLESHATGGFMPPGALLIDQPAGDHDPPAFDRHSTTRAIYRSIERQLGRMEIELGMEAHTDSFSTVRELAGRFLAQIAGHLEQGRIHPEASFRVSNRQPAPAATQRRLRIGIYPVNGNPLHWGHLLCALEAIAEQELDKVVFVIQGIDARKLEASRSTLGHRHRIARRTLNMLHPLVVYSDIGLDNSYVGEENLFRLLQLNRRQQTKAFYMVGTDHYGLVDRHGNPDTLPRLQANMRDPSFGFDEFTHEVAALFIERGERGNPVHSTLDVFFLPEVIEASSTIIRQGDLSYAPWEVFRYLRSHRGYASMIGQARGTATLHQAPPGLCGPAPPC